MGWMGSHSESIADGDAASIHNYHHRFVVGRRTGPPNPVTKHRVVEALARRSVPRRNVAIGVAGSQITDDRRRFGIVGDKRAVAIATLPPVRIAERSRDAMLLCQAIDMVARDAVPGSNRTIEHAGPDIVEDCQGSIWK